ncbi:MAG: hypothetical protein JWO25_3556 [Alphaproteobacteria bacterium]|nr:hypothetical protein [Alphaproteobacteria bacterium]MDB5720695.1 hypothetical protein [Alphaproteobacteria bacterium]
MKQHGHKRRVMSDGNESGPEGLPTRRVVLALGAIAASTVVTIRPALAQTAGSVLNCEIPVPSPNAAGNYIAADGSLVPAGTQGAFPPLARPLKGEEVKNLLNNGLTPSGMDSQAAQAYAQYIRRLQAGMSGFTCYASLQMPR